MILPIVAYGDPVLRKAGAAIDKNYPALVKLIADMFETMEKAKGIGLAAPQIGKSIRLFVADGSPFAEGDEHPELKDFKKVFINAHIVEEQGEEWNYSEGCLSIPKIREEVKRKPTVRLKYMDENFAAHEELFSGITARIIQHECDHIDGKLFIDRINTLRRTLLKSRLADISKGNVDVEYKMKFPLKK
ncbi:MAG: peptide deformylase [Nitrospirae bacterium]|nr:MAG: peptide deformylase [Bacteroidota bacterium]TAN39504.1 MAG: peptide deformylase [Nitrospirota bacterium]